MSGKNIFELSPEIVIFYRHFGNLIFTSFFKQADFYILQIIFTK